MSRSLTLMCEGMVTRRERQQDVFRKNLRNLWSKDPFERLQAVGAIRGVLEEIEAPAVIAERRAGSSWGRIGNALARSRQAVQQKYGPIIDADEGSPT